MAAIQLADVKALVLVARLGSFTNAAEAMGVSRSHVSRQVSALESAMGVTLLLRTTRTLKLTPAGEQFCDQCASALGSIDDAVAQAREETEQVRGELRINCVGGYLGEELLAPVVCRFMAQYPDVQVSLDFSSHRVDLISDEFDLALRMGELEDSGFVARHLMDIDMVTLASPEYVAGCGVPFEHPSQLEQHRCLVGSVNRWRFTCPGSGEKAEVKVSGALRSKNGRVLVTGAKQGQGIIRVPRIYCQAEIDTGELVEVFREWKIASVPFSAVYHRDRYQPKRLRAFIEFLLEALT